MREHAAAVPRVCCMVPRRGIIATFTYLPADLLTHTYLLLTAYSLTHLLTHPHPRTGCRHSHSGGPIQRRAHSMHVPTYLRTVDHYKPLTVVIQMIHGSTQLDLTQLDLT